MKPVRWSQHALAALSARGIDPRQARKALDDPDRRFRSGPLRWLLVRRYLDEELSQPMLLCIVTEDSQDETIVVTAFKTSKFAKYLA